MRRIGWGASILGDASDLDGWRHSLKEPFDPWVVVTPRGHLLRCNAFDALTEVTVVRDKFKQLITFLNGALALNHQLHIVHFGNAVEVMEDGSERHHNLLEAHMTLRMHMWAELTVMGPDGNPRPQEPSLAQKWLLLAMTDDYINDAIQYYSHGEDWFYIYKCYECLTLKYGGERSFLELGWFPKAQLELLRRTANNERHARLKNKAIDHPMTIRTARELLGSLVLRAVEEELIKQGV